MFNIFKKKEKRKKTKMQLISVKRSKKTVDLFKGQFVKTFINENNNSFYLDIYDRGNKKYITISNKISDKYYDLCDKYSYGLIYDFDDKSLTVAIICQEGYLKPFDIQLDKEFENGTAFIVEGNNLIDDKKIVGTINKNSNEIITLNGLDNNKLVCFIEK